MCGSMDVIARKEYKKSEGKVEELNGISNKICYLDFLLVWSLLEIRELLVEYEDSCTFFPLLDFSVPLVLLPFYFFI